MFANVGANVCDMMKEPARRQRHGAITEARENAGLSKAELARRIGVGRSLMTEMEAGTRNATEQNLSKIARALGCPLADLQAEAEHV